MGRVKGPPYIPPKEGLLTLWKWKVIERYSVSVEY
jgi:hypothetical protein